MLFALWDYIKYRRRMGRYSDAELVRQGARCATQANFSDQSERPRGTVIQFHTRYSYLSWMVMYYSDSVWSHLAIIVSSDDVVHSTTSGVLRHPFLALCDERSYLRLLAPIENEAGAKAGAHAETLVGRQYDWGETIYTFRDTILGTLGRYRLSYFLDAVFLFVLTAIAGLWLPPLFWFSLGALTMYGLIVIVNIYLRRRFAIDEGEPVKLFRRP